MSSNLPRPCPCMHTSCSLAASMTCKQEQAKEAGGCTEFFHCYVAGDGQTSRLARMHTWNEPHTSPTKIWALLRNHTFRPLQSSGFSCWLRTITRALKTCDLGIRRCVRLKSQETCRLCSPESLEKRKRRGPPILMQSLQLAQSTPQASHQRDSATADPPAAKYV